LRGKLLAEPSLEAFTSSASAGFEGWGRLVPRASRGGRLLVVNPERLSVTSFQHLHLYQQIRKV